MRTWAEVLDAEPKDLELAELLDAIAKGRSHLEGYNERRQALTEGANACEDRELDRSAQILRQMAVNENSTLQYMDDCLTNWTGEYDRREQTLALAGEQAERLLTEAAELYDRAGLYTAAGHVKLTALRLKQARTGMESEETDPRDLPGKTYTEHGESRWIWQGCGCKAEEGTISCPTHDPQDSAGELNARILTKHGCTGENRCDCELCSGTDW